MSHHYKLKCRVCNTELEDDGFILECPVEHEPTHLSKGLGFSPEDHNTNIRITYGFLRSDL